MSGAGSQAQRESACGGSALKRCIAATRSRFAFGDLVAGILGLLEATVANFNRAQTQRRYPVSEEVTPKTVLGSAKCAGRHADAALSWLLTSI